jgi:hypothetical protein
MRPLISGGLDPPNFACRGLTGKPKAGRLNFQRSPPEMRRISPVIQRDASEDRKNLDVRSTIE